jgi:hypothetical protein
MSGQTCKKGTCKSKADTDSSSTGPPGGKCSATKKCTRGEKCVKSICQPNKEFNCGANKHHNGKQCVNGAAPACSKSTQESVAGKCVPKCKAGLKRSGTRCVDDGKPCPEGQKKAKDKSCVSSGSTGTGTAIVPGGIVPPPMSPPLLDDPNINLDDSDNIIQTSEDDVIAGPLTVFKSSLDNFATDPLMLNSKIDGEYGDENYGDENYGDEY